MVRSPPDGSTTGTVRTRASPTFSGVAPGCDDTGQPAQPGFGVPWQRGHRAGRLGVAPPPPGVALGSRGATTTSVMATASNRPAIWPPAVWAKPARAHERGDAEHRSKCGERQTGGGGRRHRPGLRRPGPSPRRRQPTPGRTAPTRSTASAPFGDAAPCRLPGGDRHFLQTLAVDRAHPALRPATHRVVGATTAAG